MKKIMFTILMTALAALGASAQSVAGVRQIDTDNFTYKVANRTVVIKDGIEADSCKEKDADGIPSGDVFSTNSKASYGDLDGDGKEEAVVALVANVCGGNMITNEDIIVLTVKNGKIAQMPTFGYFEEGCDASKPDCKIARAPGASARIDAATKSIVVETSFATEDDAVCCPSFYRESWYKWNGSEFTRAKLGAVKKRDQ